MNSDPAVKKLFEECNRTAQKFTSLYYQAFDKRRHDLGAMYLDNGLLVWNGNGASGRDQIQSAVLQLPTTNHRLNTLDAQPIIDETTVGQATFCITCGGTVKYNGHEVKPFQQSFIITADGDKFRIVSDIYRVQDALFAQ